MPATFILPSNDCTEGVEKKIEIETTSKGNENVNQKILFFTWQSRNGFEEISANKKHQTL